MVEEWFMVVSELQATAAKAVRIRRSRSFMDFFRILHCRSHAAKLESMKWVIPLLVVLTPCLSCANTATHASSQSASVATQPMPKPNFQNRLTDLQVTAFAQLALAGIVREWPNKPSQVYIGPESALTPRAMHPVFYGSFDWHSAVHGHWLLVRLLKEYPNASSNAEIRRVLNLQLEEQALAQEAAYFDGKQNSGFERMYGWAWLLRLATELHDHADQVPPLLLGVHHLEDVLEGQRFEVEPVGRVVVGRDSLGVAVDHDGLVASIAESEGRVHA